MWLAPPIQRPQLATNPTQTRNIPMGQPTRPNLCHPRGTSDAPTTETPATTHPTPPEQLAAAVRRPDPATNNPPRTRTGASTTTTTRRGRPRPATVLTSNNQHHTRKPSPPRKPRGHGLVRTGHHESTDALHQLRTVRASAAATLTYPSLPQPAHRHRRNHHHDRPPTP